ncbi:MAG: glutamate-1-semialdehyde 2,1-aminomutase, partial [Desulfurococcaceae archaeon]
RKKVESVCLEHGVECWSTGDGSLSSIHFTRKRPRNAREVYEYRWSKLVERAFNLYSRVRGAIYASERLAHFLPSLIHGKGEVEFLINVFADFVESISRLSR